MLKFKRYRGYCQGCSSSCTQAQSSSHTREISITIIIMGGNRSTSIITFQSKNLAIHFITKIQPTSLPLHKYGVNRSNTLNACFSMNVVGLDLERYEEHQNDSIIGSIWDWLSLYLIIVWLGKLTHKLGYGFMASWDNKVSPVIARKWKMCVNN